MSIFEKKIEDQLDVSYDELHDQIPLEPNDLIIDPLYLLKIGINHKKRIRATTYIPIDFLPKKISEYSDKNALPIKLSN